MYFTDHPSTLRSGTSHDVIVVGARAAGAATAMLLARRGLRTLLLDDALPGSDTPRTHALMRGGVLQLSRWGLLDKIVAAGTPPVKRTTFRYGDEHLVISVKSSHGVDALYAPRDSVLDPLLVQAAVDSAVDLRRAPVVDVMAQSGRVVGVRAATADAGLVELGAALVIGADGIDSTIARRVGAKFSRVGRHGSAIAYAYWTDLETDGYEWTFHPTASSAVIPTNHGQAFVFVGASPDRIGEGGTTVIRKVIAEAAPKLAARLDKASPASDEALAWSGHPSYIRQSHGPGWALVGAAGYFADPISAHGLTDALRDAELLARAVVDGLGSESTLDAALGNYQITRDRLGIPLFDAVDQIAGQRWGDTEIAQLVVQMNAAMADEAEALVALGSDSAS